MAKPQYNTEQLIENIKRRCSVPTSQLTYTEEDFVLLANDELQGEVVPLIMSTRDEYFVDYVDVLSPADGIIPIPSEAVGAKLRSICYVQQTQPLTLINLPLLNLDVVAGVGANFVNGLTFTGFYLQGNDICLYPNNSVPQNTQIRIYYYKRSLVLAAPNSYGQITSINTLTKTVVLDSLPSDWRVGDKINAISQDPNFTITLEEAQITALSAPSLVLSSVDGLGVGDYVSLQGYSAIPQIPVEAHAYLAQLTAAKALEGLGDTQGMANALEKAKSLKDNLLLMTSQRVDGSPKKVISPNGGVRIASSLRGIRRGGWGF